jgi:hypothetical protein
LTQNSKLETQNCRYPGGLKDSSGAVSPATLA